MTESPRVGMSDRELLDKVRADDARRRKHWWGRVLIYLLRVTT